MPNNTVKRGIEGPNINRLRLLLCLPNT